MKVLLSEHIIVPLKSAHLSSFPHKVCRTSFSLTSEKGEVCGREGTLVRFEKARGRTAAKNPENFSLCYAPARPGDTDLHVGCDPGTYHWKQKQQFCCINPVLRDRTKGSDGRAILRHDTVCADALADVSEHTVTYKRGTVCGPRSIKRFKWGERFLQDCFANDGGFTKPTNLSEACRGETGTLLNVSSIDSEIESQLFCPSGTTVLAGQGGKSIEHSWACKNMKEKIIEQHCCRVSGEERCVASAVEAPTNPLMCDCDHNSSPINANDFL